MSLQKCTGCKAQVDTEAATCPFCGKPDPTNQEGIEALIKLVVYVLVGGFAITFVITAGAFLLAILIPMVPTLALFLYYFKKRWI